MKIIKKISFYVGGIIFLLCAYRLLVCCTLGRYASRIELMPDMEWILKGFGNSEIVWGDKGVVAQGDLTLVFCDDGIEVSCRDGRIVYLDVVKDVVLYSSGSFIPKRKANYKQRLSMFSAEGIMGSYGKVALNEFKEENKTFLQNIMRKRIELELLEMYVPKEKIDKQDREFKRK